MHLKYFLWFPFNFEIGSYSSTFPTKTTISEAILWLYAYISVVFQTSCSMRNSGLYVLMINNDYETWYKSSPSSTNHKTLLPLYISLIVSKLWILNLMLLVISLLTLFMSVGFNNHLKLTQYVIRWVGLVLRFLTIYNTCMFV